MTVTVPGPLPPPPTPQAVGKGPGPFIWDGSFGLGSQITYDNTSNAYNGSYPGWGGFGGHPTIPAGQRPCRVVVPPVPEWAGYGALLIETWAGQNPGGSMASTKWFLGNAAKGQANSNVWIAGGILFPGANDPNGLLPFPAITRSQWFQFFELYGSPFKGSPQWALGINPDAQGANCIVIKTPMETAAQPTLLQSAPIQNGVPIFWKAHVVNSSDPTQGLLELWLAVGAGPYVAQSFLPQQGVTLTNNNTTARFATLGPQDDAALNYLNFDCYHTPGLSLGVYHWCPRVAATSAAI